MAALIKNLESFQVSRRYGFVSDEPSYALGPCFEEWEAIAATLPHELANGSFQTSIFELPPFDTDKLTYPGQWQRAYVILGFLIHAWVHGCAQSIVPPILAEPFLQVCKRIGTEPVLSYAGLCLYNWTEGHGKDSLCGHRAVVTFTGTFDEAVFYLVPVLVEKEGGILVAKLLEAQEAAVQQDWEKVLAILDSSGDRLQAMIKSLEELKALNPHVFYHKIRPYIAGLNVIYQRAAGDGLEVNLVGGSAGQSSFFQVLDHLLGVRHESSLPADMRSYMPGVHRDFINEAEKLPSISKLLESSDFQSEIRSKIQQYLLELRDWRSKHVAVVTRYIMLPAQAAARRIGTEEAVVGTAGSSPVAFLKQIRDETDDARVKMID